MNFYQLKYSIYEENQLEEETYKTILLFHEKNYTQKQFQNYINLSKSDMGYFHSFEQLVNELEKYGFKEITVGYYQI